MTHLAPAIRGRALPQHPQALPGARDRHAHAADPGRARRALQLRRRRWSTSTGARRVRNLYADRRGGDDRPARRLPAGLELAARGDGVRRARRRRRARRAQRRARRRSRPGTPATPARPTRRSWSATTGTRSGASCGTTSASCAPTGASSAPRRRIELIRSEIREYYWNVTRHRRSASSCATSRWSPT